jgi:hypothetical protein
MPILKRSKTLTVEIVKGDSVTAGTCHSLKPTMIDG